MRRAVMSLFGLCLVLLPAAPALADDPAFAISSPADQATIAGTHAEVDVTDSNFCALYGGLTWMVDGKAPVGNGFQWIQEPAGGSEMYEFDSTDYTNGPHTFTVSDAYCDTGGQQRAFSSTRTFTVANNDPAVTITSPGDGATTYGTALSVTADATPDPKGSQTIDTVEFFLDDKSIGTDTLAPYDAQIDTTTLTNGPHTLYAQATDSIGLVGVSDYTNFQVGNFHSNLTSSVSRTAVNAGSSAKVTGTLGSVEDGTPIADQPVDLQVRRADQTGWARIATVTSDPGGAVSLAVSPRYNSYYRWVYNGDAGHTPATSAARLIKVTPSMVLAMSSTRVAHGTTLKGRLTINPPSGGQPLTFQERKLKGSWVTLSRGSSTPTGTALHVSFSRTGTYDLRILRAANSLGQAASSNLVRIYVH